MIATINCARHCVRGSMLLTQLSMVRLISQFTDEEAEA